MRFWQTHVICIIIFILPPRGRLCEVMRDDAIPCRTPLNTLEAQPFCCLFVIANQASSASYDSGVEEPRLGLEPPNETRKAGKHVHLDSHCDYLNIATNNGNSWPT